MITNNKLLSAFLIVLVGAATFIFIIQVKLIEEGILENPDTNSGYAFLSNNNTSSRGQEYLSPEQALYAVKAKSKRKVQTTNATTKTQGGRGRGVRYNNDDAQGFQKEYINKTSRYCLTENCIAEIAKPLARAFPQRTNKEEWCIPKNGTTTLYNNNSTTVINKRHHGLILVKVPKAASSTAAAVVLRLGHRHDCDMDYIHAGHMHAYKEYAFRGPTKSFMLASVRDPAKQLTSFVFWTHVSQSKIADEDIGDAFLLSRFVYHGTNLGNLRHFQGGEQTQFVALQEIPRGVAWNATIEDIINPQDTVARIQTILDGYDFILVSERMDESLVVLSLLLDVPVGDVLVSSSKVSAPAKGENGHGGQASAYVYVERYQECLPMRKPKLSPLIRGWLESDLYRSQVYGDLILHSAANQSLDLTIDRLGRERFQKAMEEYKYWKQKEKKDCATQVQFPCSRDGVPQLEIAKTNCYKRDFGCGHQCVDEMLAKGKDKEEEKSWWWFW